MSHLNQLYHEVIVDHGRHPRNFGILEEALHLQGHNPLCGDTLTLYLKLNHSVIEDAKFVGEGCAISMASTSLMLQAIKGKTVEEAKALFSAFHRVVLGETMDEAQVTLLGKLMILKGVSAYPSRIKCASLAWHTLDALLQGQNHAVSTESGESDD